MRLAGVLAYSALSLLIAIGALAQQPSGSPLTVLSATKSCIPQGGAQAEAIQAKLEKIRLPEGFKIGLYALVPNARALAVGLQGAEIFVSTNRSKVFALKTGSDSGSAETVTEFAPAIAKTIPHGLCFSQAGVLFVVEQNRILAFADAEAAPDSADMRVVVAQGELIPKDAESSNHSARVCRVGPDDKLYVALGQPYNVPPANRLAEFEAHGIGGIVRMTQDGGDREIFARGIRNSVGLDFNPQDHTLWFTDNQVDGMGDDIPPGELNRATKLGQHFGFPWYGGGHVRTLAYKNATPPADLTYPEVEMVAHAADLGMTFYTGTQFPKKYQGGIFSAQHGSWDRSVPIGARVMFTPVKADGTAGAPEVFAEGWLNGEGLYDGRPVDVAPLRDGSLLVSDDFAGAVYRITYEGE